MWCKRQFKFYKLTTCNFRAENKYSINIRNRTKLVVLVINISEHSYIVHVILVSSNCKLINMVKLVTDMEVNKRLSGWAFAHLVNYFTHHPLN